MTDRNFFVDVDKPSTTQRCWRISVKRQRMPSYKLPAGPSKIANVFLHVDIMPSGGITLEIVFVYRNPRITIGDDVPYDESDNIISSSRETLLMQDILLPDSYPIN